ncbi:hypothetical protein EDC01DRAFT_635003 [Geopyxis carbonaria]|nr:hypothetical protein EDC01DRAFT_635003 [Geopyxis carbonaria]
MRINARDILTGTLTLTTTLTTSPWATHTYTGRPAPTLYDPDWGTPKRPHDAVIPIHHPINDPVPDGATIACGTQYEIFYDVASIVWLISAHGGAERCDAIKAGWKRKFGTVTSFHCDAEHNNRTMRARASLTILSWQRTQAVIADVFGAHVDCSYHGGITDRLMPCGPLASAFDAHPGDAFCPDAQYEDGWRVELPGEGVEPVWCQEDGQRAVEQCCDVWETEAECEWWPPNPDGSKEGVRPPEPEPGLAKTGEMGTGVVVTPNPLRKVRLPGTSVQGVAEGMRFKDKEGRRWRWGNGTLWREYETLKTAPEMVLPRVVGFAADPEAQAVVMPVWAPQKVRDGKVVERTEGERLEADMKAGVAAVVKKQKEVREEEVAKAVQSAGVVEAERAGIIHF